MNSRHDVDADAVAAPVTPAVADLTWVGDGAWVARDPAVPVDDPLSVIAFIEHTSHRVLVQWVRGRHDVSVFDTLREAVQEVSGQCLARHGVEPRTSPSRA